MERELPVAGEHWPWGDPHGYPHSPAPGRRRRAADGRRAPSAAGSRCGSVRSAIANGSFGNRPHCIYRGFCLQGCKVGAKASPLVTHVPDALAHGVEIRADCMATRIEIDEAGRCTGVTYFHDGRERFQARRGGRGRRLLDRDAAAAAALDQRALPERPRQRQRPGRPRRHGPGRAPGRRAASPKRCACTRRRRRRSDSEQFYETDEGRGFARGFSIQTVGPLPIGWAEHVLADGHWGQALREYMRDYNHWYVIGALNELLPLPENRVTLAEETDAQRHAGRPHGLQPVRERPRQHRLRQGTDARNRPTPPAPRTC